MPRLHVRDLGGIISVLGAPFPHRGAAYHGESVETQYSTIQEQTDLQATRHPVRAPSFFRSNWCEERRGLFALKEVTAMPAQTLLRPAELAERVGVHVSTIRRWAAEGRIPGGRRTLGGHYLLPSGAAEDLAALITVSEEEPAQKAG